MEDILASWLGTMCWDSSCQLDFIGAPRLMEATLRRSCPTFNGNEASSRFSKHATSWEEEMAHGADAPW